MRRTLSTAVALLAVAGLAAVPSEAAVKKKPKPIKGSYTVTLPPDPSKDATSTAGEPGCAGLLPISKDSHPFTLPAAGTLVVKLVSDNPTGQQPPAGIDWDLYLMEDGFEASAGDSPAGTEEAAMKVKKKTNITIDVCNLNGFPNATVSYVFTYR